MSKSSMFITDLPDLMKEWDFSRNTVDPATVKPYSHTRYWWICSNGHSRFLSPNYRARGNGCPYCSGRKIVRGENDLATSHPEIAVEWNFKLNSLSPEDVSAGSCKRVWWICPEGHEYALVIKQRTSLGYGCPYCSGRRVLSGFNDLLTKYPSVAADWDYEKNISLTPEAIQSHSGRRVWWKCSLGHSWDARIADRTSRPDDGCPYCSNHRVLVGFNDLASKDPALAAEWDHERNGDLDPVDVTFQSRKKVWWICPNGHYYQSEVRHRSNFKDAPSGCPYCSNKKLWPGFNDLASRFPSLANQWDYEKNSPLRPDQILAGSNNSVWWICSEKHSWKARISARTGQRQGCPYCLGSRAWSGYNDMASRYPSLVEDWDIEKNGSVTPDSVTVSSRFVAWWICSKGHSWSCPVVDRCLGQECPICSKLGGYISRLI